MLGVTVKSVEPETPLQLAVIVVVPVTSEVTSPLEPAVLLIVAMDCDDELQLTKVVSTCVALSENVPMAVNCSVAPADILEFAGVTPRDVIVAEVTVRVVEPEKLPDEAVIVALPVATAVANP